MHRDIESTNDPVLIKSALVRGQGGDSTIPMIPPNKFTLNKQMHVNTEPKKTKAEWVQLQSANPDIGPIVELLKLNKLSQYTVKEADTSVMRVLLKYQTRFSTQGWVVVPHCKIEGTKIHSTSVCTP